jgi:acetolactate synthase-1/2/3 large subunit
MATCGEVLVKLLEGYGVESVRHPGVHTVELYRGLARSINHVTPRSRTGRRFHGRRLCPHRGKPGVCFIITGPGMTNITTAMGQAYADSIPMLVISSVQSRNQLGGGRGKLHELPNQSALAPVAAFSHTLMSASGCRCSGPGVCAVPGRPSAPGAHENSAGCSGGRRRRPARQHPGEHRPRRGSPAAVSRMTELLAGAKRPLILAGGGAIDAAAELTELAELLDAPVA